ncbi:MAG: glycosyltransferase family 2 protein [Rhodoferax sp.]|nr:glycosyltransferase family 2 protein [Rhodoferax sp.]
MSPSVAILLCTMQGQHFLHEQLDSIVAQTHSDWSIWASDDGSDDGTHAILEEYRAHLGSDRFSIHSGPAEGFAANFLSLVCNANITADFYAFSDQDDVWNADKLRRAVDRLGTVPNQTPALYCSRTCYVDANNQAIGASPLFTRPPAFANALVQSIAGGNTMVLNDAARNLLRLAGADANVASHDWWAYMVISGCGGIIFYEPEPTVRYRQHDNNLEGANTGWSGRLLRLYQLLQGRFRVWNDKNTTALQRVRVHLTPENQHRLDEFEKARTGHLFARLAAFRRSGVYRQTSLDSLSLLVAVVLKKL